MQSWLDDVLTKEIRRPGPPLRPKALAVLAESVAGRAADWWDQLRFPPEERWFGLLHATPRVELWLLTWQQESATELHDHGDAAGACTVVTGELEEIRASRLGRRLRRRSVTAGQSWSFSPGYVHDMVNRERTSAVSVHAYSPPLTSMTFYELQGPRLVATRTQRYGPASELVPTAAGERR
jgi:hypothetical protein